MTAVNYIFTLHACWKQWYFNSTTPSFIFEQTKKNIQQDELKSATLEKWLNYNKIKYFLNVRICSQVGHMFLNILYPPSERSETGGYTVLLLFPSVRLCALSI